MISSVTENLTHYFRTPDAPVLLIGDFNSCQLDYVLPAFKQYVDVSTRFNKTIDLCNSNIQEAYKARALPPLGLADHNVIHLLPVYKQRLKQHKPMIYSTPQWSEEAITRLQGCSALEGDTGVNSQTSPVPLPQKCISSHSNPTKKLGENPVPFHSRKNDSHSLPQKTKSCKGKHFQWYVCVGPNPLTELYGSYILHSI